MAIPVLGRLTVRDHISLVVGFAFVILEMVLRCATFFLPAPLLALFYNLSARYDPYPCISLIDRRLVAKPAERTRMHSIQDAHTFDEMCAEFGYEAQEHVVQTQDGYILCLHRLCHTRAELAERDRERGSGERPRPLKKPVVYLHHGLMMNSEVWVCNLEEERQLPFILVERGYDVWFGNNRGNKYSKKHITLKSNDKRFWDFSMDDFALRDIPDSIAYVLHFTKQQNLSYIGFSQGTAQAFATLSIHPSLNEMVNVFIALAPAMSPRGLHNIFVDALMKASPTALFLFFGRKAILPSTVFWQSIMYPPFFVRILDLSMKFLFGWHSRNMTFQQKAASYYHLYSFASVKSLVHWFQIIRSGQFQMYDDDLAVAQTKRPVRTESERRSRSTSRRPLVRAGSFYQAARFPTRNIAAPIVLMYGGSDSLVEIDVMLSALPSHTITYCIPHFEHLDFLWGQEVDTLVIPQVLAYLKRFEPQQPQLQQPVPIVRHVKIGQSRAVAEDSPSSTDSSTPHTQTPSMHPGPAEREMTPQPRRSSLASVQREGHTRAGSPTPPLFQMAHSRRLAATGGHTHRRGSSGRPLNSAGSSIINQLSGSSEVDTEDLKALPTTQLSGSLDWDAMT
ncbi:Alpha/Beta hydrolase protein [Protomyces lactucae-debilis]|uniref:Alpha/Beta hydrolase protein n=1 Tax=Protomyces lactucae-debilis TaxID=2754530 RepID=A0A1Y2FH60_PROLT|nr:Alpha/Beta hydrolase protein [Protomyces lactucae-debilis]ORY83263.1 Alpha/Beta hydrolase protein [Protomyces lactucae-debilis]